MDREKLLLETKIPQLLLKMSAPAILGMVVQALYNVVDTYFVGNGISPDAIAGTTAALPFMNILTGISMLFGVGTSTMISIRLGEKRKDLAEKALANGFIILVIISVIITVLGILFIKPILKFTAGAPENIIDQYAIPYARVIVIGTIAQLLGFGMSHIVRAEGATQIAMYSMLIGAIINIILDALFIYACQMGIAGAAWATIIAQTASLIYLLSYYLSGKSLIKLKIYKHSLNLKIITKICSMGMPPFLMQLASSFVITIATQALNTWGYVYVYEGTQALEAGATTALSAYGIAGRMAMMVLMPMFGLNQGCQPIVGYNYGAKQFDRVKHAYKLTVISAIVWATVCFVVLMSFPGWFVNLFTKPDPMLYDTGIKATRLMMCMLPFVGFQVISSNYFTAVGKSLQASLLSLSRQVLLLIPLIYILPSFISSQFGEGVALLGVFAAVASADFLSCVITAVFIVIEFIKLKNIVAEN